MPPYLIMKVIMFVKDTVALFHKLVSCILKKRWCVPDSKAVAKIENLIMLPIIILPIIILHIFFCS